MKGCFNLILTVVGFCVMGALCIGILSAIVSGFTTCSKRVDSYTRKAEAERIQSERKDPSSIKRWKVVNGKLKRDHTLESAARSEIARQRYENQQSELKILYEREQRKRLDHNKTLEKEYEICRNCGCFVEKGCFQCNICNFTINCQWCNGQNTGQFYCSHCNHSLPEVFDEATIARNKKTRNGK